MKQRNAETIFNEALAIRSGEERQGYLRGACGGDADLLAKVERLLGAEERSGDFLPTEPGASPTVLATPVAEGPGSQIGRYKLLQQIGEGGFGFVYMAEQKEPVKRRVALKIIKLGMDTKQVVARFEAERQALALMDHPNIAKVLDGGATESGRPYFVMELVKGMPLTKFCDENKLSTKERLELFTTVCHAIQHAHQKGIIHRDVKPSNVLVTLHDGKPVPKVIDFGIAKATQQELTEKTIFTQFQQMIGTPAYMSPEQAEMSGLDIDTRTDVYSLGVLLYELLTGKTPLDAKILLSGGYDEIRRRIKEEEPQRPSTRVSTMEGDELTANAKHRNLDPKRFAAELRGDLDWIVMKALEKDRTRRYDSATGFAQDIERFLGNEPVVARPPSAAYRLQKMVRRNKLVVGAAAAVTVALMLGLVSATVGLLHAQRERDRALTARQSEERARAAAEANEKLAREQELATREQELATRRLAYASDMRLAQGALQLDNLGHATELLNRHRPKPGQPDLRHWEWRYLWQFCQSDALFTLCQQTNLIYSLAVSHDGGLLAIGEGDAGGLSIWDLGRRQELARIPAGESRVIAAFSPREPLLAFSYVTGLAGGQRQDRVRLWDVTTRRVLGELRLGGICRGLSFSDDGQTLLTSTARPEHRMTLWRVSDGNELGSFEAPIVGGWTGTDYGNVFSVAWSAGLAAHGTRSAPGTYPYQVRLVELPTGKERWRGPVGEGMVTAVALSPDGKWLAASSGLLTGAIRIWEVSSGKPVAELNGHRVFVASLLFLPDGRTLASASADRTIRLWDLSNITNVPPPRILVGHQHEVWWLALLPDGKTLVSGSKDGAVNFWDTSRPPRRSVTRVVLPIVCLGAWQLAPDGQSVIAVNYESRKVERFSGNQFERVSDLMKIPEPFVRESALLADDGPWLVVPSTNGIIGVWNVEQGRQLSQIQIDRFSGANTSPAGDRPIGIPRRFLDRGKKLIVDREANGSMQLWDLVTGRPKDSWQMPAWFLFDGDAAEISSDEEWFLALGHGRDALLRNLRTGVESQPALDIGEATDVAFSPDGRWIAVSSHKGFARVWDRTSMREAATLSGFLLGVDSVGFSPDSKRLVTGAKASEAVKVWDLNSRQLVLVLEGEGSLYTPIFSADGNVLAARNWPGAIHLWRAPSWAEIEAAERAQTSTFSRTEQSP